MDVFRILLSLGLVVLLWRLDVRGIRPIRNFILWGLDYPFHFLLTATLILVIWGVIGSGFGLQGLLSQSLYENVVKNLKRLEMLADWWATGRVAPP